MAGFTKQNTMKKGIKNCTIIAVGFLSVAITSCKGPKFLYSENLLFSDSSAVVAKNAINFEEPPIQFNDLLFIQVQTADQRVNELFNNNSQNINLQASSTLTQGYQVGIDSAINFPMLGKIKAFGLTRNQLENLLVEKVSLYIKEKPSVQVRFLNYRVNVLGEVARPGSYSFPSDRVTILDAIGTAGDLTLFARRNKVWLIREENKQRKFYFINLQKSETFDANTFFLKQNDIVYVEPTSKKFILADPTYNRTAQNISIGFSSIGLVIAIVSILRR